MNRFGIARVLTGLLTLLTIFCPIAYGNQGEALIDPAGGGDLKHIHQLLEKGSEVTPQDNPIGLQTIQTDTVSPVLKPAGNSFRTKTPVSPLPDSFYRLRIKYATTSDWTTLTIKNSKNILTLRTMAVHGKPDLVQTSPHRFVLSQSLDAAQARQRIGVTVDLALAPDAVSQPLEFLLRKGALNDSTVRVYNVSGNDEQLIQEIEHHSTVPDSPEQNPLVFQVNLSTLKNIQPFKQQIQRIPNQKMLWAFYYPWYHPSDWSSPRLKDHPITPYSSSSSEAIARQIEQAQGAGIDGFISSWWGPGTYTDKNLKILLEIAEQKKFNVTIYFETLHHGTPISDDEIFNWLAYVISTYRDHPSFMKVDGKPLVVIWAAHKVPLDTWKQVFAKLRHRGLDAAYLATGYNKDNLEVFDGLHQYGVFTIPNLAATDRRIGRTTRYYSLLTDPPVPKIWAATAQPGYDERLMPKRKGQFKDRDDGAYYQATFDAAIQSDPDWIFITTWNEWWEHTYIEPSELYGEEYLRITREFAEKWKRNNSLKLSEH